jgi:hypothetical protein
MRYLTTILLVLLFASCDPSKRIMKDVEQFDKIGNEWAIRNPSTPKVETISKRDTLFRVDSVKNTYYVQSTEPGGKDTVYHKTVVNNRFYYYDSTTNTVTDTRQVDAYKKLLNDSQVIAAKNEARYEAIQKQLMIAVVVAAGFFLALILLLIIFFKKR